MKTMINRAVFVLTAVILLILTQCRNSNHLDITHIYRAANYAPFEIAVKDTIHFKLPEHAYNNIVSSNFFQSRGVSYCSFYDKGSKSLLIYNYDTKQLLKHVRLVTWVKQSKLDKASVFTKGFDSIFITTQLSLFHLDSSGTVKRKIDFFPQKEKVGTVNNTEPAILMDGKLYIGIKPNVNQKSLTAHRAFRCLYRMDLTTGEKELIYPLPNIYHKHLYGYPYMEYGYCINDKGNIVFSFAADTNIYETDLISFQKSYSAQSRFHKGPIPSLTLEQLEGTGIYKLYTTQDSYGPVIYDPFNKIYLRQAKKGISGEMLLAKNFTKKKSIIILDNDFNIIGEPECNFNFSFTSMFFTATGKAYVRINTQEETAIHFAEISFKKNNQHLTKDENRFY